MQTFECILRAGYERLQLESVMQRRGGIGRRAARDRDDFATHDCGQLGDLFAAVDPAANLPAFDHILVMYLMNICTTGELLERCESNCRPGPM